MTNSSVGFPQFYQIQQILDRFLFAVCDTANNIAFPVKEVVPEKLYFSPGKKYTNVTAC
ncbi:hypothetical protein GTP00_11680 [Lactiplantibacillus plantarum]|nr:hypothetical protein [Lactiplantibacillus plantarum]